MRDDDTRVAMRRRSQPMQARIAGHVRVASRFIRPRRTMRDTTAMRPRYVAARRPPGRPCRHLSARRLRHMESRFYRMLWTGALAFGCAAYLAW
jgi:hypothetical protein